MIVEKSDAAENAIFTHIADDVGGNTDFRDVAVESGAYAIVLSPNATFTDNSNLQVRGSNVALWGDVSTEDVGVYEAAKTIAVPIKVSGTKRETPFSVTWQTFDGTAKAGEDYESARVRFRGISRAKARNM